MSLLIRLPAPQISACFHFGPGWPCCLSSLQSALSRALARGLQASGSPSARGHPTCLQVLQLLGIRIGFCFPSKGKAQCWALFLQARTSCSEMLLTEIGHEEKAELPGRTQMPYLL